MTDAEYHRINANTEAKALRFAAYLRRFWAGLSEQERDGQTLVDVVRAIDADGWNAIRKMMGERSVPNLSLPRILQLLETEDPFLPGQCVAWHERGVAYAARVERCYPTPAGRTLVLVQTRSAGGFSVNAEICQPCDEATWARLDPEPEPDPLWDDSADTEWLRSNQGRTR